MSKQPSGWHRKRKDTPAERARDARYRTPEYRAAAKALKAQVDAGNGFCWRCGRWLDPNARLHAGSRVLRAWHVGHDDTGTVIRGAECALRCNLSAAARKGARTVNAKRNARTTAVRL